MITFNYSFFEEIHWLPEHKLLSAILYRALKDMALIEVDSPEERDHVIEWILNEDESPFSFKWICSELRLSARIKNYIVNHAIELSSN
jgi:hypothetical protein